MVCRPTWRADAKSLRATYPSHSHKLKRLSRCSTSRPPGRTSRAVSRAAEHAVVNADLPFGPVQMGYKEAVAAAIRGVDG